ncbi:MAG: metallophosphoesterase family protein, partial [Acidimicrobiales bacterium]
IQFTTMPRPPGQRLATVATVNDVHFGEVKCGQLEGLDLGPILQSEPDEDPYPWIMNRAAVAEISALSPDAVVAKGDLTSTGAPEEYDEFEACYRPTFGDRLHIVAGNHDVWGPRPAFASLRLQEVVVPGAVLAIIDTSEPGEIGGVMNADTLEWLDDLATRADRPVLVFGHHPCWEAGAADYWMGVEAALDQESTTGLAELIGRRKSILGYFAGHTHRNRVRHLPASGDVPLVEVACVKDYPGSWAEYRIFEGGVVQVHRRLSSPEALSWSERCREMFSGLYPSYAFGALEDRSFVMPLRGD